MNSQIGSEMDPIRPGRTGLVAIYLVFLAVVARTLTNEDIGPLLPQYLRLELVYVILFSAIFMVPRLPAWPRQLYFIVQSALVLRMLSLKPEFDFIILLIAILGYQASLFFGGRMRWAWVGIFILLTGGPLIFYLGVVRGLALSLTTMAAEIVIPAYLIVNQENEAARAKSQILLEELQNTHHQLELYTGQVEELAAMQERNRLARELHDTVSQLIFSISLMARSARLLLEKDPKRVPGQLALLQETTTDALSRLRSLISQLRPTQPEPWTQPHDQLSQSDTDGTTL